MKVLVDLRPMQWREFAGRGIGTYARNLLRVMRGRFHGRLSGLAADNFPPPAIVPPPAEGVSFYRPRLRKLAPFYWLFDRIVIRAKLRNSLFDVLHVLEPFRHAVNLPRRCRTRVVCTVHDLIPLVFPERYFPGGLHGRIWSLGVKRSAKLIPRIDRIIAISEHTKRDLVNRLGVDESRITVVYQSVDRRIYRPEADAESDRATLNRLKIPDKFILYVGDVDWRKDLTTLIRAFARLRDAHERKVKLVMVGRTMADRFLATSPEALAVWEEINKNGVADRIIASGYVSREDLAALYRSAACMVFPSVYEGFGLPPLEAMACGCPVITTDASSLPEVVGDAGITFSPGDYAACAESVRRVLEDKETAAKMRSKGLARAEKFSDNAFAGGTIAAYRAAALAVSR